MSLPPLPIDAVLRQLINALRQNGCAVLRAPTGSGKTTRAAPAMLDAGLAGDGQLILLQPRRLAATASAWRIAAEMGVELGQEVGYHVRFDRRANRRTRLLVMTEGMFLRLLQSDPLIEQVGAVVFDEFHERTLDADLALAIARRLQLDVRPELKLLVMSATLDPASIARFLGNCPAVEGTGRLFPVDIRYAPADDRRPIPEQVADGVRQLSDQSPGDLLAFLPGVGEIRRTAAALGDWARRQQFELRQLYGDLPLAEQQAALAPSERRRVVLSTNVAETSLTIEGVTAVVDSGYARVNRLDPSHGINGLQLERISRASADQRAGRAGRLAPGVCLRLWTKQTLLAEHDEPEIARVDLSGALLNLLCWDEQAASDLKWFEPPRPETLVQAHALLRRLGATGANGRLTPLGHRMRRMPVEPRMARLLYCAEEFGHAERLALVAALLSDRDPLVRSAAHSTAGQAGSGARKPRHASQSDVVDRAIALEQFENQRQRSTAIGEIDPQGAKHLFRVRDQLLRAMDDGRQPQSRSESGAAEIDADEAADRAILAAYGDRIARRREPASPRAVMVGGRGVRLHPQSAVRDAELFACVDIQETGQTEAVVRQASAVEREWLPADLITTTIDVEYDVERKRIFAVRRERFVDLIISEAATSVPADADLGPILAKAVLDQWDDHFFLDEAGLNYLARVRSLADWMPELGLPPFGEDPLRELLLNICRGRRGIDEVRRAPLTPIIQARLTHEQIRAVAREAPEKLPVPSGSQVTLRYQHGQPPVMAVRIQEVFGMHETPRVAAGRVPVVMHLLAPNMRPQQITSDLRSFWRGAYAEVRKELRRRYPKHSWPEDPTTAEPMRGAKRRPQ